MLIGSRLLSVRCSCTVAGWFHTAFSERHPHINSSFMNISQQFMSCIIDYFLMYTLKSEIYCHIILQNEIKKKVYGYDQLKTAYYLCIKHSIFTCYLCDTCRRKRYSSVVSCLYVRIAIYEWWLRNIITEILT
jgi:hypothetical protein